MVSMLAFSSDDPSSNPAEVYHFSVKLLLKRTKLNKKEAGVGPIFLRKVANKAFQKTNLLKVTGFCYNKRDLMIMPKYAEIMPKTSSYLAQVTRQKVLEHWTQTN